MQCDLSSPRGGGNLRFLTLWNLFANYPRLRNNASGPEIGLPDQISTGFYLGDPQNRTSGRPSAGRRADFEAFPNGGTLRFLTLLNLFAESRTKAGRRADFEAFPTRIRPKTSPEAQFPTRKHYCVT